MQLRRFILAGIFAVSVGAPAFAAMPATTAPKGASTDVVNVAAQSPATELKLLKRKKKPTDADMKRIDALEAQMAADRAAAKAKAIEARKMAMREAAKARAEQARADFLAKKNGTPVSVASGDDQSKTGAKKKSKAEELMPVEPVQGAEVAPAADVQQVVASGNNGELRSEAVATKPRGGFFDAIFGTDSPQSYSMLPQTQALDAALAKKDVRRPFKVKPEYMPQEVEFTGYAPGTIVINTKERRLYLVDSYTTARRYAIAVGREGLQYKGDVTVGDKQEWPRWIPTLDMQKREPNHYGRYKDGMPGGTSNPLGARAIYLYDGKKDTHLRIHGTIEPQSIGTSASNGCFRMINEHVMDLYNRVHIGQKVVVL